MGGRAQAERVESQADRAQADKGCCQLHLVGWPPPAATSSMAGSTVRLTSRSSTVEGRVGMGVGIGMGAGMRVRVSG